MLTIGSRGSKLALWQANYIKSQLQALGHECRIEVIQTSGDRFQQGPLKEIGNKGLFTKEIEEALLDGRIDVAVHSLKDMPTKVPDGLQITATPEREDAHDVIVGRKLSDLPTGARIGTGSLRRVSQLRHARPELQVDGIRGNVDTRLRKLDEGQFDAIVLAAAGLRRLGWESRIAEYLDFELMCPAAGQGALAVQTRADDSAGTQACRALDHRPTHLAVAAERAVLDVLGGGCQVPIGAYGVVDNGQLHLRAVVIDTYGSNLVRRQIHGAAEQGSDLGAALGRELLDAGAREILAVYGS